MKLRGSCLCGAIEFEVEEPFTAFVYCHCSRCRRKTGSAHAANALVPSAQFAWTRGAELVRKYDVVGTRWSSAFCPTCGSGMPFLQRPGNALSAGSNGGAFVVPAGSLQGDLAARPRLNIFFGSRAPWYTHASELETVDTIPGKASA